MRTLKMKDDYAEQQQEFDHILHEPQNEVNNPTIENADDVNEENAANIENDDDDHADEENEIQEEPMDVHAEEEEINLEPEPTIRKSTRERKPVDRLNLHMQEVQPETKRVTFFDDRHNLLTETSPNPNEDVEYTAERAPVIARVMVELNQRVGAKGILLGQQHILQKGLKLFQQDGYKAAVDELDQLHRRVCFTPMSVSELTPSEKKKAMEALMLLSEKKDKSIKGRMVYNGKPSRAWMSKEESTSPTTTLESIMITGVIDAHEERDVMTADVPNK